MAAKSYCRLEGRPKAFMALVLRQNPSARLATLVAASHARQPHPYTRNHHCKHRRTSNGAFMTAAAIYKSQGGNQ